MSSSRASSGSSSPTSVSLGEVLDDGVAGRGQRDGDQGAGDPGDQHAAADGHDHAEGVDPDEAAHQERLQHVALELLDRDHARRASAAR